MLAETDQLFTELDVTKQFRDDRLESEPHAETPSVDMKRGVAEWLREQSAGGMTVSVDGQESKAQVVLRELKHQPDIKYVRVRRPGDRVEGRGNGRVWAYVGVRLKPSVPVSTVSTP